MNIPNPMNNNGKYTIEKSKQTMANVVTITCVLTDDPPIKPRDNDSQFMNGKYHKSGISDMEFNNSSVHWAHNTVSLDNSPCLVVFIL